MQPVQLCRSCHVQCVGGPLLAQRWLGTFKVAPFRRQSSLSSRHRLPPVCVFQPVPRGPYQGTFGEWRIEDRDITEVWTYRAGLTAAAAGTVPRSKADWRACWQCALVPVVSQAYQTETRSMTVMSMTTQAHIGGLSVIIGMLAVQLLLRSWRRTCFQKLRRSCSGAPTLDRQYCRRLPAVVHA
jgi:hypothetical protein